MQIKTILEPKMSAFISNFARQTQAQYYTYEQISSFSHIGLQAQLL